MRWIRFRFDPGRFGGRGSFPWVAWNDGSAVVIMRDNMGEVVLEIRGASKENARALGQLLEEVSWGMREAEDKRTQCSCIVRTVSEHGIWGMDPKAGGPRWKMMANLLRLFRGSRSEK